MLTADQRSFTDIARWVNTAHEAIAKEAHVRFPWDPWAWRFTASDVSWTDHEIGLCDFPSTWVEQLPGAAWCRRSAWWFRFQFDAFCDWLDTPLW